MQVLAVFLEMLAADWTAMINKVIAKEKGFATFQQSKI